MGSSLLFEVENWPGLPGTFTFERRASLLPADRVLNSAEKAGKCYLSRQLKDRQRAGSRHKRYPEDSLGRLPRVHLIVVRPIERKVETMCKAG